METCNAADTAVTNDVESSLVTSLAVALTQVQDYFNDDCG